MGVSTDAMLFYGYVWEDEAELIGSVSEDDDEAEDDEAEWAEIIAARRGILNPWCDFPQDIERLPYDQQRAAGERWTDEHRAELDAWSAATKAISEEYGVEIDHHGSGEWRVPVVKIAGVGHTASRGYPHQLTAADLAVDPEWDGKLRRFITDLGIDASEARGPGWFVASWWG